MKGKSPTSRTNDFLKAQGFTSQVVEKWNAFAKVRVDLFGCIDIVSLQNGRIIGIQVTSEANHSARVNKALEEPRIVEWIKCGGKFQVHSWGKQADGKWHCRVDEIELTN